MACCLLKSLLNRLPTKERLHRFGILSENTCVLCEEVVETRDHLYFECPFSEYVWSLCRIKLNIPLSQIGNITTEADLLKGKFNAKDITYQLARLAFFVTVWNIWQERTKRIFLDKEMNKIMVFRRIYEDINILLRTSQWKVNSKEDILANWNRHVTD